MNKAMFVVGLPGSGKTYHLRKLASEMHVMVFDDFKAKAIDDNPAFDHARRLPELVRALKSGRLCAVADIDFCREVGRREAQIYLQGAIPELQVEWHFFANEPALCRQNVLRDVRNTNRKAEARILAIERFSTQYEIPADAKILRVWSDSTS